MGMTLMELERTAKEAIDSIFKLGVPAKEKVKALGKIEVIVRRLNSEAFDEMREESRKGR